MDPFVEWKLKKLGRLRDIPEELLRSLELKINNVLITEKDRQAISNSKPATKSSKPESEGSSKPATKSPKPEDKKKEKAEPRQKADSKNHGKDDHADEPLDFDGTDQTIYNFDGGRAVRVSSEYGYRVDPINGKTKFHNGVDVALRIGEKIYSIEAGVVVTSAYDSTSGKYLVVDHADGRRSQYLHLSQKLVNKGDKVSRGQAIALSGNTGRSTGPHLHFIIKTKDKNGKWNSRKPTVEEVRMAVGGREISNLRVNAETFGFPLVKKAINVSIEPFDSIVSEAVTQLEAEHPGYFSNIKKVVVELGSPAYFGKVESDKKDTIYLSLNKIKSQLGAGQDPEKLKLAIIDVLAHEMGHLKSNFQGGESPAETEADKVMRTFNAK
jgi:murein DD-endopeptidase MepM/ murein hydrolase activator NlpD